MSMLAIRLSLYTQLKREYVDWFERAYRSVAAGGAYPHKNPREHAGWILSLYGEHACRQSADYSGAYAWSAILIRDACQCPIHTISSPASSRSSTVPPS